MKLRVTLATVCVLALALVAPASADLIHFDVLIDGAQAGTPSPGVGTAGLDLDTVAMTLSINLTFSGLVSPTTNAHIHCCAPPGSNAPVVLPFVPAGFPLGVTSGSFNATFPGLTPVLVADILSGLSYINIHTVEFPAGEIRGQIVSEPATLALVALALWAAVLARRRRC
jgi:hypothetical protein